MKGKLTFLSFDFFYLYFSFFLLFLLKYFFKFLSSLFLSFSSLFFLCLFFLSTFGIFFLYFNIFYSENAEQALWKAAEILELVRLHAPYSRFTLKHLGYVYEYLFYINYFKIFILIIIEIYLITMLVDQNYMHS